MSGKTTGRRGARKPTAATTEPAATPGTSLVAATGDAGSGTQTAGEPLDLYDPRAIQANTAAHALGTHACFYTQEGFEQATRALGPKSGFADRMAYQREVLNPHHHWTGAAPPQTEVVGCMASGHSWANAEGNYAVIANRGSGRPDAGDGRTRLHALHEALRMVGHVTQHAAGHGEPTIGAIAQTIRATACDDGATWAERSERIAREEGLALARAHTEECYERAFAVISLVHDGYGEDTDLRLLIAHHALMQFDAKSMERRTGAGRSPKTLADVFEHGVDLTFRAEMAALRMPGSPNADERAEAAQVAARSGAFALDMLIDAGAGRLDLTPYADADMHLLMIDAKTEIRGSRRLTAREIDALGIDAAEGVNAAYARLNPHGAARAIPRDETARQAWMRHMLAWCHHYVGDDATTTRVTMAKRSNGDAGATTTSSPKRGSPRSSRDLHQVIEQSTRGLAFRSLRAISYQAGTTADAGIRIRGHHVPSASEEIDQAMETMDKRLRALIGPWPIDLVDSETKPTKAEFDLLPDGRVDVGTDKREIRQG